MRKQTLKEKNIIGNAKQVAQDFIHWHSKSWSLFLDTEDTYITIFKGTR